MFANGFRTSVNRRTHLGLLLALVALWLAPNSAQAGGPRFITGSRYPTPGLVMSWANPSIQYFTDPADLSSTVTHAQADAVVAAAAAVWNVPTSSLVLSQGGTLAEHVSGSNTYFDGTQVVFPSDVEAATGTAKPIAIVYDQDGSVTDLLLGQGASSPSSCRQNEVVESVDGFNASGGITHAVIVINGRCVGSLSDQLNELQYKLMRIFGRVLGLGWSQLNDNVFTGTPTPTAEQMANWPVMHPMDVVCGLYEYLCMVDPFVLRMDDLSALAMLYPVIAGNVPAGKTPSGDGALKLYGFLKFPYTNDYAIGMVNLTATRVRYGAPPEGFQSVSGLTGILQYQNVGNPVTGGESASQDMGMMPGRYSPYWEITRVPVPAQYLVSVNMEPVNPLYSGAYSVGPFQRPPISLPGAPESGVTWQTQGTLEMSFPLSGLPSSCSTPTMGFPWAPYPVDSSGTFRDVMCGNWGFAWKSLGLRAGRSWTIEVTALDNAGGQTASKLMPVIGVWNSVDAAAHLPPMAVQPVPLNSASPGMTQLLVPAALGDATYDILISDFYGWLRPDFTYKARVLYADNVTPATIGASGGQITITGMGFATGNRVTVNGVVARVVSWSANQIVATAPSAATAKAAGGIPVNVAVLDLSTGGSSTITGALTYPGGGTDGVVQVSAPTALETGVTATTPFAVQVVGADGVTAVPGASVRLAVTAGNATLSSCGLSASCVIPASANGIVQTRITGVSAGTVTVSATEVTGGVGVQITLQDTDPARTASIATQTAYVAAGAKVSVPVVLTAVQDGAAAAQVPVAWTTSNGLSISGSSATDGSGAAAVNVGVNGMGSGLATVQGCIWGTVCVNWSLISVDASQWQPAVVSGAGQSVAAAAHLAPVGVRVTDAAGHALIGAPVTVSQTASAWEGACPATGRCAAAPVLASNVSTAVTDGNGLLSVQPLDVSGTPEVVHMAVSSGTSGFLSLSLVKTP